jgi:hypothetical protein
MHGKGYAVTEWADIGNAVGCGFDESEQTFVSYTELVLLGERIKAYPAPIKTTAEKRVESAEWAVYEWLLLAQAPLTLSGLAAMMHTGIPVVRDAVAALERLGLVVFGKHSRQVFRKPIGANREQTRNP